MHSTNYTSIILALCLHLAVVIFANKLEKSPLSPGAFFSNCWLLFITVPLIFAPEYYVDAVGIFWISVNCFVLSVGALSGRVLCMKKQSVKPPCSPVVRRLHLPAYDRVFNLSIVLGLSNVVILLYEQGGLTLKIFNLQYLLAFSHKMSVLRYSNEFHQSVINRLFVTWIYVSCFLAGLGFITKSSKKYRLKYLIAFLPPLLVTIILTTKASLLFSLIIFMSAIFSIAIFYQIRLRNLIRKYLSATVLFLAFLAFLVVVFYLSSYLRVGSFDIHSEIISTKLKAASFGYLAVFSYWFKDAWWSNLRPHYGVYTFAGIFDILGIHIRELGLYGDDISKLNNINSNVYTWFRCIIEDFSIFGSILFVYCIGFVSGFSFQSLRFGHFLYLPIIALFFTISMWSFVTAASNYNTINAAFIIVFLYLFVAKTVHRHHLGLSLRRDSSLKKRVP